MCRLYINQWLIEVSP